MIQPSIHWCHPSDQCSQAGDDQEVRHVASGSRVWGGGPGVDGSRRSETKHLMVNCWVRSRRARWRRMRLEFAVSKKTGELGSTKCYESDRIRCSRAGSPSNARATHCVEFTGSTLKHISSIPRTNYCTKSISNFTHPKNQGPSTVKVLSVQIPAMPGQNPP